MAERVMGYLLAKIKKIYYIQRKLYNAYYRYILVATTPTKSRLFVTVLW